MHKRVIHHLQFKGLPVLALLTLLLMTSLAGDTNDVDAQQGATLEIRVPAKVRVGKIIPVDLVLRNANNIAGYEMNVVYDTTAAHFSGLHQRNNDLRKLGRDIVPLDALQEDSGVAIGLASCRTDNCVTGAGAVAERGGNGDIHLAKLLIGTDKAGKLKIRFDAPRFVDAAGNRVPVTLSKRRITVRVGNRTEVLRAPASKWELSSEPERSPAPGALELNRDRRVSFADIMEVAMSWSDVRHAGSPCRDLPEPAFDVNRDGCVDVADVQLVAASSDTAARIPEAATAMTFTVNTTNDAADSTPGDGVCNATGGCTLRAAIDEANINPGPDTILFSIPGGGVKTITLKANLPAISGGGLNIDGYSQPGSVPNTDAVISNAQIMIQIVGNGSSAYDAFRVSSGDNIFRGFAIYNARRKFYFYGAGATDNIIVGNFLGSDATTTFVAPAYADISSGVYIEAGAARNRIGGTAPAERNIISGNARHGIELHGEGTDGTIIYGNIVGLSADGTRRVENRKHGIDINRGAASTLIGGLAQGQRNVISGNGEAGAADYTAGVEISHDSLTSQNQVVGNFLGTDVTGNAAPYFTHNSHYAIRIEDAVTNNVVSDNVIVNSQEGGVKIDGFNTSNNRVFNNRIGVGLNGAALGNLDFGIQVKYHGTRNTLGPNNIISNSPIGVHIEYNGEDFNEITQNSIFNNSDMGIDLGPTFGVSVNDQGDTDTGANQGLNYPVLTNATTQVVSGTACAEAVVQKPCRIEVFIAQPLASDKTLGRAGQGITLVGSGLTQPDGTFAVAVNGLQEGDLVTATATDAQRNTSEYAYNISVKAATGPTPTPVPPTPTPVPQAEVVVADTFARTVTDSWGAAELGGSYGLQGSAVSFDVDGNYGSIRLKVPNATRSAYLTSVSVQDLEFQVRVAQEKPAEGGSQIAYVILRRVSNGYGYVARIRYGADGTVRIMPMKEVNNAQTELAGEKNVPGATQTPGQFIWLRGRLNGTSPANFKLKAWVDGQTEPANWLVTVTDSTAELQAPGGVGLRGYLATNATNHPTSLQFDDFEVTELP